MIPRIRFARETDPARLKEIAEAAQIRVDALRSSWGMASRFRRPPEHLGIHYGRSYGVLERREEVRKAARRRVELISFVADGGSVVAE